MKRIKHKPCYSCGNPVLVYRTTRNKHFIKRYIFCTACGTRGKRVQAIGSYQMLPFSLLDQQQRPLELN